MDKSLHLHWIDMLILVAYLLALVGIGVYHSRKQKDLKDFFLAGKSIRWVPIGLSLMAALNSGMDYIMQPAGMIKFGAVLMVVNLTWFFLYPYVFFITLPMFRRMGGYTVYEYLEHRFGASVRLLTASIFIFWRMGWMAAALYTPCLAIAVASGHREYVTYMVIILGIVVTFYTMMGGIKAVIWTDVTQFCIMFGGLAVTFFVIFLRVDGGLSAMFSNLFAVGSEKYVETPELADKGFWAHTMAYFFIPIPLLGFLFAALLSRVTTYTSDQVMIQRFQTSKSIRDARQGFLITAIGDTIWMFALCFLGVALYTYFQANGWPPQEIQDNPDQLFPYFMGKIFPIGMTGLVISAILAASLSSIDSAINSICTVVMVDFYKRLSNKAMPNESIEELSEYEQRRQVFISRCITAAIGITGILIAINVSKLGTILEIANKLVNGFTGPILGIFLLGMFTRRANEVGVFIGGLVGALASLYAICWSSPEMLNTTFSFMLRLFPAEVAEKGIGISFIWPSTIGLIFTLLVGYLASLFSPKIRPAANEWNWYAITRKKLIE